MVSRARIVIPDPEGVARAALALGQKVRLRFGYRGEANFWQGWEGSVAEIGQPGADAEATDAITVQAVGLEKALTTTLVKESFYGEPAAAVARRLLSATGLPVGAVEIPGDGLPYQVFSNVPVALVIKQLANTLRGLCTTCENLIANTPPETLDGVGVATSVLLPGLTHSRLVHITDTRRGLNITARALDVVHSLAEGGNTTIVTYGKDAGWA